MGERCSHLENYSTHFCFQRSGPRRPGNYYESRDYPPPPRDYAYRDDYGRYPPGRDARYDYPPPPPRDYRRPLTPPRDYRDYPPVTRPPPRDYDDYRMRPPSGPPRPYYPNDSPYPRGYDAPPRDFERRGPAPPGDRYPPYSATGRPRTPPGPPPRGRDDYDRPPPRYVFSVLFTLILTTTTCRDFASGDYRGRPTTPPMASRYGEYPPRTGGSDTSAPRYRYVSTKRQWTILICFRLDDVPRVLRQDPVALTIALRLMLVMMLLAILRLVLVLIALQLAILGMDIPLARALLLLEAPEVRETGSIQRAVMLRRPLIQGVPKVPKIDGTVWGLWRSFVWSLFLLSPSKVCFFFLSRPFG